MALPASKPHDSSFPKCFRLRQRAEFVRLSQTGIKYSSRYFILLIGNAQTAESRLGITVSRKVGNAVIRNKVKRRLRDILRQHREMWPCADFVFIARSKAAQVSYSDISNDILSILQRVV